MRFGNMRPKACLLGLITMLPMLGFVSTPARAQNAASVDQTSSQYNTQVGGGNSSVNASEQSGIVSQKQPAFGSEINAAHLGQDNSQGALQSGWGNNSVQGSVQSGTVIRDLPGLQQPAGGGASERRPRPPISDPPGIYMPQPTGDGISDQRLKPMPHVPGG